MNSAMRADGERPDGRGARTGHEGGPPGYLLVTKYGGRKKGRDDGFQAAPRPALQGSRFPGQQSTERPVLRRAPELECGPDVEHPLREEVMEAPHRHALSRWTAAQRPRTPRGRLSGRPRRRTPRTPGLDAQEVPVGQQVDVGGSPSKSRVSARRRRAGPPAASSNTRPDPPEPVPDDRQEELPLRPEQLEQVRLPEHADGAGDRFGRGPGGSTPRRRRVEGGRDGRVAPLVGGLAGLEVTDWHGRN